MKLKLNYVFGSLLLLVGGLFILSVFGWAPYELTRILISWQALIVVVGFISLLYKNIFNAAIVILVGLFFFIPHCFWVYGVDMPISRMDLLSIFVAAMFIVGGLFVLFGYKRLCKKWTGVFDMKKNKNGFPQISCLFGEIKHTVIEKPFNGVEVSTAFGSTLVDMTKTTLSDGDTFLDVNTAFGSTIIIVPHHWVVYSTVHCLFGTTKGLKDRRFGGEGAKRLVLRGASLFGEIEIRFEYVNEPIVFRSDDENSTEEVKENTIDSVSVKHNNQVHIITLDELQYIQADGDYVTLCTAEGKFLKEQTMKYFQNALPSDQFLRIHRSYIVNLSEIKSVDFRGKEVYYVVLKDGTSLRSSAGGYQLLKEKLEI